MRRLMANAPFQHVEGLRSGMGMLLRAPRWRNFHVHYPQEIFRRLNGRQGPDFSAFGGPRRGTVLWTEGEQPNFAGELGSQSGRTSGGLSLVECRVVFYPPEERS